MTFSSAEMTACFLTLVSRGIEGLHPKHTIRISLINTLHSTLFGSPLASVRSTLTATPTARGLFLGFNSQLLRATTVINLVRDLKCDAVCETGTCRGETSLLLAIHTSVPLYGCEVAEFYYAIARALLSDYANRPVHLYNEDSRRCLERILRTRTFECPFFYLDSHWQQELPLLDELRIVGDHCNNAIVMIDDFLVPGDSGFGYDRYEDDVLAWPYIRSVVEKHFPRHAVYYPSYPSSRETGYRRGSVLIAVGPVNDRLTNNLHLYGLLPAVELTSL